MYKNNTIPVSGFFPEKETVVFSPSELRYLYMQVKDFFRVRRESIVNPSNCPVEKIDDPVDDMCDRHEASFYQKVDGSGEIVGGDSTFRKVLHKIKRQANK